MRTFDRSTTHGATSPRCRRPCTARQMLQISSAAPPHKHTLMGPALSTVTTSAAFPSEDGPLRFRGDPSA
eukprot:4022597-Pyramimonas_sp.AAC.1